MSKVIGIVQVPSDHYIRSEDDTYMIEDPFLKAGKGVLAFTSFETTSERDYAISDDYDEFENVDSNYYIYSSVSNLIESDNSHLIPIPKSILDDEDISDYGTIKLIFNDQKDLNNL